MRAAWFGTYMESIPPSPHAAELLDAKRRLSADVVSPAARQYKRMVRDVLAQADAGRKLDLKSAGTTADTAAELVIASAKGLLSRLVSPAPQRIGPG